MNEAKIEKLFELAEELYTDELKKSGMVTPIPYAFVRDGGRLVVVSMFGHCSERVEEALKAVDCGNIQNT